MATFAYARVRSPEQDVPDERLEIERAGYCPHAWFVDAGVPAGIAASERKQFKALLAAMGDGEQLVVTKLDRLGRDAHDIGVTIKMLGARKIKVVVLQLGKIDLTSNAGSVMVTMLSAMAELERGLLIERSNAPKLAWLA